MYNYYIGKNHLDHLVDFKKGMWHVLGKESLLHVDLLVAPGSSQLVYKVNPSQEDGGCWQILTNM